MLRPRYWRGWMQASSNEEENMPLLGLVIVMDAIRVRDGIAVGLKRASLHTREAEIIQLLNSEPLVSHPDNACIPLYEILNIPNDDEHHILVMLFLHELESPPFETLGEVMEFCRQALYGLRFFHCHNIAHGDPHSGNIMLDPTTIGRARAFTQTQCPSRYYWIDYNLAHMLEHPEKPGTLRIPYTRGGDRDIPETMEGKTHANPFASDIWWGLPNDAPFIVSATMVFTFTPCPSTSIAFPTGTPTN
ncbi:hypothetical protein DFH07DRAFT_986974 [Mycena maculata]|uniref:Protein kinase domain-containing protein n=1 Tax=Mycena maculata TaxID=230809 RepID=A0AAD7I6B0_9AGAR|nr:hypothetical protein DFH07DRAFT_986974 [Mycena maculata]